MEIRIYYLQENIKVFRSVERETSWTRWTGWDSTGWCLRKGGRGCTSCDHCVDGKY